VCDDEKPNAVDKLASAFMLMWLLLFRLREIDLPENRFLVLQFGAGMFFAFVIVCVVVNLIFLLCACVRVFSVRCAVQLLPFRLAVPTNSAALVVRALH
jgi:hypothetical protein